MSLPVWKNKWDTLCHKASPPLHPLTEGLRLAGSLADECCTEELAAWAIRSRGPHAAAPTAESLGRAPSPS